MCISLWSAYTDSSISARLTVVRASRVDVDDDVGGVRLHRCLLGLQRALAAARTTHSELQRFEDGGKVARVKRVAHLGGDFDEQVAKRQRTQVVAVRLGGAGTS